MPAPSPSASCSDHGIAYEEYAVGQIYEDLCGKGCQARIAEHWAAVLDGRATWREAVTKIVSAF
jgi:hypothetical protein